MKHVALLLLSTLCTALAACGGDESGEILLSIDADADVQSAVRQLAIRVRASAEAPAAEVLVEVAQGLARRAQPPRSDWPVKIVLRPERPEETRALIEVRSFTADGAPHVRADAALLFRRGARRERTLTLQTRCIDDAAACALCEQDDSNDLGPALPGCALVEPARDQAGAQPDSATSTQQSDAGDRQDDARQSSPDDAGAAVGRDGELGPTTARDAGAPPNVEDVRSCLRAGRGTPEAPCEIATCAELSNIDLDSGAHYALVADVNCTEQIGEDGQGFMPLAPFSGSLDGRGHRIVGLRIFRPDRARVGLFSELRGAHVHHLTLDWAVALGRRDVGILAGSRDEAARIEHVTVTGSAAGDIVVNGLVGGGGPLVAPGLRDEATVTTGISDAVVGHRDEPLSALAYDGRDAGWRGVYRVASAAGSCLGAALSRRVLLVPAACVCGVDASAIEVREDDVTRARGRLLRRPDDPSLGVALLSLDRELRLGQPVVGFGKPDSILVGATLSCEMPAARRSDGHVELKTTTATAATPEVSSPADACGSQLARPDLVLNRATGELGAPCFYRRGEKAELVGIVVGDPMGTPGMRSLESLRAFLEAAPELWMDGSCGQRMTDNLLLEPSFVADVPHEAAVSFVGIAPIREEVISATWTYGALRGPWAMMPSLRTAGLTRHAVAGARRADPSNLDFVFLRGDQPIALTWSASSFGSERAIADVRTRTALSYRASVLAFVNREGSLGLWRADGGVSSPAELPDPVLRAREGKPPTLAPRVAAGELWLGYRKLDGTFATRTVAPACRATCSLRSAAGECLSICDDETTWDLPNDLEHVVIGAIADQLWAVTTDVTGEIEMWRLDTSSRRAIPFGRVGTRAIGRVAIESIAGELFLLYTGVDFLAHRRPLAGCLRL